MYFRASHHKTPHTSKLSAIPTGLFSHTHSPRNFYKPLWTLTRARFLDRNGVYPCPRLCFSTIFAKAQICLSIAHGILIIPQTRRCVKSFCLVAWQYILMLFGIHTPTSLSVQSTGHPHSAVLSFRRGEGVFPVLPARVRCDIDQTQTRCDARCANARRDK